MVISICLDCRHIEGIFNAFEIIVANYGLEQVYNDPDMTQLSSLTPITQTKKRFDGGNVTDHWAAHLDFDEFRAMVMAANGTDLTVPANDSSFSTSDLLMGMPNNLGRLWDADSVLETEDDISDYHPPVKSVADEPKKPSEAVRSHAPTGLQDDIGLQHHTPLEESQPRSSRTGAKDCQGCHHRVFQTEQGTSGQPTA